MRLFAYVCIFCMLLFLLLISFDDRNRTYLSTETNQMGTTLMGDGETTYMQSAQQMNQDNIIYQSQEDNTTVLDMAGLSLENAIHNIKISAEEFFDTVWYNTKLSAYKMASDIADSIYPKQKPKSSKIIPSEKELPQTQPLLSHKENKITEN
ncbi:MAG: hypothetical protein E7014_03850 [Alphaproteobacteria bacterium]|nr:hypothetical protein [Alphaproteobacteria bacterium]